jgi:hypothetical protein
MVRSAVALKLVSPVRSTKPLEGDLRVALDAEEVRAAQVLVAVLLAVQRPAASISPRNVAPSGLARSKSSSPWMVL